MSRGPFCTSMVAWRCCDAEIRLCAQHRMLKPLQARGAQGVCPDAMGLT